MPNFTFKTWKPVELETYALAIWLVHSDEDREWPNRDQYFAVRIPMPNDGTPPLYYELCKAFGINIRQPIRLVLDQMVGREMEEKELFSLVEILGW